MPRDDTSPPSEAEAKREKCGGATALLSFIPRFGERPADHIFSCAACRTLTWIAKAVKE